jgi:hypothetical protein
VTNNIDISILLLTGWGGHRELLVVGLPPPPLGGCEEKNKQIPLGSGPSYGVNEGTGLGGPLSRQGNCFPQTCH